MKNHKLAPQPTPEPPLAQSRGRAAQRDHAFPMLNAQKLEYPPHFRFMWVAH